MESWSMGMGMGMGVGCEAVKCPRCESVNTKFCYYNNYNLSQPRHLCKSCRRYWTRGGVLRNVPVGGGCRKQNPKSKNSNNIIRSSSSSSSSSKTVPPPPIPIPIPTAAAPDPPPPPPHDPPAAAAPDCGIFSSENMNMDMMSLLHHHHDEYEYDAFHWPTATKTDDQPFFFDLPNTYCSHYHHLP